MNKTVQVTGMELKTKVSGNLLICGDNVETNYSSDTLSEGRKALLEPVSSVSGLTGSFFYTIDATARGNKLHTPVAASGDDSAAWTYAQYDETTTLANVNAGKKKFDTQFNGTSQYNIVDANGDTTDFATAYGYVDYVFYLKATADALANDTTQSINMTQCSLTYKTASGEYAAIDSTDKIAGEDLDRAWRVAVFAENVTTEGGKGNSDTNGAGGVDPAATAGNAKGILTLDGAQNFNQTVTANDATPKAVASETALGAVTYNPDTGIVLGTLGNNDTAYYKVTVRVWLEGEDDTCNSATYAALQDGQWRLETEFKLVDTETDITDYATGEAPVTRIGTVAPATWEADKAVTQVYGTEPDQS